MEWCVAEPDVGEEARRPPPGNVSVKFISPPRTREHAIELVENGAIHAALDPYSKLAKNPALRRLLADYRQEEANYFRRAQVIPVIHTLVLREELVSAQPWVIESLVSAFRKARMLAEKYMNEEDQAEARWLSTTIDYDPYTYRLDPSARKSLETLIQYQIQQGLLEGPPALQDILFPESMNI
jgi:4,5-dihydroxyphthalate decarboxylase